MENQTQTEQLQAALARLYAAARNPITASVSKNEQGNVVALHVGYSGDLWPALEQARTVLASYVPVTG